MSFHRVALSVCLSLVLIASGCPQGANETRELGEGDNVINTDPPSAHQHHDQGPHRGHILEFGEYHGEITHKNGIVTVYVLDAGAEKTFPLENALVVLNLKTGDETQEIPLAAALLEGEEDGKTSSFASSEGALPASVNSIEDVAGSVVLTIGEEKLTAEVTHDHDHDHDHEGEGKE